MARNPPIMGINYQQRQVKAESLRLSDLSPSSTTSYFEIIVGDGAPSGGYGRDAGATMLYGRRDASSIAAAFYGTIDGGTTWVALQFLDAELAALAGLVSAADSLPYFTGSGTAALATFTAFARTLLDDADALTARATLGLVIGTNVQAYDAGLLSLAALPTVADRFAYSTAADTWAEGTITAAGRALLDDASAAAQATTLGLGTGDSPVFAGLHLTGDLVVDGATVQVDAESVLLRANYLLANVDYATAVAQPGGLVVNYLPTATVDTTLAAGVVTAGVDGVSDPTITTAGAATFAATDIVQISGSDNDGENDGLYEVLSHAANLLTLKSTSNGVSDRVEGFTADQLVANAGDTGMAITKVTVSVARAGTDGVWEVGSGSQTGIAYSDLVRASDIGSSVQAYDATLTSIAALGTAADKGLYSTGIDTWAEFSLTAAARTILDDASVGDIRTTLGVGTGDSPAFAGINTGTGTVLSDYFVRAVIAVADVAGGGTDAALTVDLYRLDGTTVLGGAKQIAIRAQNTQYAQTSLNANVTFGTAVKGSIIASGAGWALVETDADGEFDCAATNAADETVYFSVYHNPPAGQSDSTKSCIVLACNSDAATWSA